MPIDDNARLRGQRTRLQNSWALGTLPRKVVVGLGRQIVHRMAIGHADITGDDFGTIFANAVEGTHLSSPLGIADVVLDGNAWSVKTIWQLGRCLLELAPRTGLEPVTQ